MLHDNMNSSFLIMYSKHVEDARAKRKNRYAKRVGSFGSGSSKNRVEIQDKHRFNKRVYNKVPSKLPKDGDYKVTKTRVQKGKDWKLTQ